jgi:predicted NBD/HSP70 family sugar kinase
VSRVEIAELSGLTQASVSMIVRSLLQDGLVREVGTAVSTGGKRRTLLEIAPDARCAVGVHLEADSIVYVVTNMAGGMIGRFRRPLAAGEWPGDLVPLVVREIDELLDLLDLSRETVVGIGVAAAGPLDHQAGALIGSRSLPGVERLHIRDELSERTGLPVVLDKDATAAAVGEFWGARVEEPRSFACLYMGQGIGAGIVINGTVFRGSAGNAGEIGHVSLDVHGAKCPCGSRGCLELYAAPPAVVARARAQGVLDGVAGDDVTAPFDRLARAAVRGEPAARALVQESARYVAEGALTLVNLTDLDLIVLGGPGFAIAGAVYIEAIRELLEQRFFARRTHGVEVRFSTNPRDAAALGVSALVLQRSLAPRD